MSGFLANTFLSFPLMGKVGQRAALGRIGCGAVRAPCTTGLDARDECLDWRPSRRTHSAPDFIRGTSPIKGEDGANRAVLGSFGAQ